jgi:hypothetical protein
MIKADQYYVFFVPPGWLLAGKVETVEGKHVSLSEAAYIELTEQDTSPIGDLPRATTEKEMKRICKRSWPLEPGTVLHLDGILIAVPCSGDLSPVTRAHVAKTIRGAK